MIDKILCEIIERDCTSKEVGVLLSGGVDSTSLAFAALRLGKRVSAYTFHIAGYNSYDSLQAKKTAQSFGWSICDIEVPIDRIEEDFQRLASKYECKKKTHFECTFPFLYVYPEIQQSVVLSGVAADGHYGVSKKACIHYKEPKSLFDEFRSDYFEQKNPAGLLQQLLLASEHNIKLITPYLDEAVVQHFRKYDWYELNKPYQKHHVREAFPEFENVKIKNHINLQLGAGIDKLFEREVLSSKKLNFNNRIRVMDICRDWSNKGAELW